MFIILVLKTWHFLEAATVCVYVNLYTLCRLRDGGLPIELERTVLKESVVDM